ncbi:AAA family ATPase [Plantactinospora sp. B5E13]|uniref:AAA family ATPase n=1 Tax=Plantactinospora sp. B5E13 TaxID=3153758 RepID=UPI00325F6ADE
MDGTETGWGRPAESAPRWRALLDRALHGSRTDEHQVLDERSGPGAAGGGLTGGGGAGGPGRSGRTAPPGDPGYPSGYGPHGGPERPGESRYAALENGYRHDSFFGPEPGRPAEAGWSDPGYRPEPGYPAAPAQRPDPGYRPEPGRPADGGHPGESRYAALGTGWRPPAPPPPPVNPPSGPPPLPRRPPPQSAAPALPYRGRPDEAGLPHRGVPEDPGPARRSAPEVAAPPGRVVPAPRAALTPPPAALTPPPAVPVEPAFRPAPTEPAFRPTPARPAPGAAPVDPPARYGTPETGYARSPVRPAVDPAPPARAGWPRRQPDAEVERAIGVLKRDLGSPRVLAFANPKGGVHKTTATVLAAATIGGVRGRGVLAWDDNELRGTLGLRAGSARHARTIRHLVAELMEIEVLPGNQLTERLDDYLRHASDGSYDVLAGEESPRFAQRLDQHTVKRVLELLRRSHDVICVDTGNNVESSNWQTVLRAADQLVVTTVPREDAAFTADWMLDLLHEIGMGELVENAVTLLSCPTPGQSPLLEDLKRHFATRTRAVAVVPYDPALETGSSIEYAQLQQETRDAWLQAASMMIEPFAR